MFKPGLDQPPGRGDGDLDISTAGVPGMGGRMPSKEPPVVLPTLLRESEPSSRWRFGGCFAADERLRRWPEAEKEFGEATAEEFQRSRGAWNGW